MIVVLWQRISFRPKWISKYIYNQWLSKDGIVYLSMILNVNKYANVILERFLRANEDHIGVKESILTVMKQIWTQMNVYYFCKWGAKGVVNIQDQIIYAMVELVQAKGLLWNNNRAPNITFHLRKECNKR